MSEKPLDDIATKIMAVMVRMGPKPRKDDPAATKAGEAQRRRREKERQPPTAPTSCD
jgi:hypothetical protein